MVSYPEPSAPRFCTTYLKGENGTVITRFEIAPSGDMDGFAIYVEGTAKRK
jgi:hypothetical protein